MKFLTNLLIKLFIKDSENLTCPKVRSEYITLGSAVGILCNIILFIIKLLIGIISGSVSVTADAFNNLSDVGSSVVTALGFKLSEKPADKEHPFGHGRIEYMSGIMVAVLIILVGVELIRGSFEKILNPSPLEINLVTIIVLSISILIKFWMFLFNKKVGRLINSTALVATARDSVNDAFSTFAVLVSIIICYYLKVNIDPYVGIAVAIFIIYSGFKTIKETIDPLLGTPPDRETIKHLETIIKEYDECFLDIHDLIIHNYGPGRSFASVHVEVPSDIDIIMCHEKIDACEKKLEQELKMNVVIHMDPIEMNDEFTNSTKQTVVEIVKGISSELAIHDFRMVNGEHQINLIFDVVVPNTVKLTDIDIKNLIRENCKKIDERFETVITIDRNFI